MRRRALITGASGFVGKHLRKHLSVSGWDVVGADVAGAEIACDVSKADQVAAMLQDAGAPTHVFHLAAIAFVPTANADPSRSMAVNLEGTIHLARAMVKQCPKARLLFAGTSEAYGPPEALPVTESHPLAPQNPYAISKAAADHFLAYMSQANDLHIIRARAFNHAGPGQSDTFVLSSFARQVAEMEAGIREPRLAVGNLSAARDFLHVKDVVRAYEVLATEGTAGEAYNICSGSARPISEAVDRFRDLAQVTLEIVQDPARQRPVDVLMVRGSFEKLHGATGWQPMISFDFLLFELLNYWRSEVRSDGRST